ncbi:acetyl esterase/lipase [Arcicella aurantiaca]|uniref:Acetyl esterase/lipase n=1 Tax=Arcicella aurantiaca TaxID=591202 RepID=A0A316ELI7_9BACT|nr:alpha/beta hydrolase [Arcicella aurantiaca]PWK23830.1 acetyl esterase/lipase [Arcicella aurantiaca]
MKKIVPLILFCLSLCLSLSAQKTISLYDQLAPNSKPSNLKDSTVKYGDTPFVVRVITPELTMYLPEKSKATGIAVVVCPGGGYSGLAAEHEGHAIAKKLQANGIAGFVLKYRLPNTDLVNNKEFVPLQDAQRAIQIVRENAQKWGINPHKIGIQGNSAGGHLASTAGTHFMKEQISNPKKTSLRPDFMVLNYPVISFADNLTHYGSRFNLIGEMPSEELNKIMSDWQNSEKLLKALPVSAEKVKEYSNELQVTSNTPPTFITHANDDDVVPVQNSILFIAALQQNKVPVESFFYAKGGHGYGMDNPTSDIDWIGNCIKWIKNLK